tara:strand:- start:31238 stop:34780 length:3543 start_codon:yes stop_codon:yes gene_type:complete
MAIICSKEMRTYFDSILSKVDTELNIAKDARKKGLDPVDDVEIRPAKNSAERVIGLISIVAPQIIEKGVEKRILDLEKKFGVLDKRVALTIALEIAQEKYCKFKDKKEAMEIGIRTGFAYITLGVVSSPLEGFTELKIKKRRDGKEYFCMYYSGPIRSAGATIASWSLIIGDYIRIKMGYAEYDPDEKEIKRIHRELSDFHDYVTNLQYFPSENESNFLGKNLPIEISGDPSEKWEVSNYKDLPRIETNLLRSGFCLMQAECMALKAPKVWKDLIKWCDEFDLGHWRFLEEFIKIQKKSKARDDIKPTDNKNKPKITPDYTYISDLVAGRPVLGFPLRTGGFRLRYGRARTSGYSALAVHPATMQVLNDFFGYATHIKVERPSKGGILTPCDTLHGPIVKLKDQTTMIFDTEKKAKKYKKEIQEILFLGDLLISYGDFFDRAHSLVPVGYCEEWWIVEFEKSCVNIFGTLDPSKISDLTDVDEILINDLLKNPFKTKITAQQAILFSERLKIPLHPLYTYHWKEISCEQLIILYDWLNGGKIEKNGENINKIILQLDNKPKRLLELIGLEHLCINNEFVVIEQNNSIILSYLFNNFNTNLSNFIDNSKDILKTINNISKIKIRDKNGTFIGARMGRPEKAKMRKLTGSPQVLFPIGDEGGRLRSFQSALEKGKVTANFPVYKCDKCNKNTIFRICENCNNKTKKLFYCNTCGLIEKEECETHGRTYPYQKQIININYYFNLALKRLKLSVYPDLIKGVRGTSSKDHTPEHIAKGILRAKNNLYVNKDGTIRLDASEAPLTHFKPKEINVSIEKLKKLGYNKDYLGKELINENQIIELKVQDIIIPCCRVGGDEPFDDVLFRVTKFVDDCLEKMYGLEPYYNLNKKEDLIGNFVVALAPHISAGTVARIIGFSQTQALLAHPLFHACLRRDCDGDEAGLFLLLDGLLNFSRKYLPGSRGSTQDAPLVLTSILIPTEVDDMAFNIDIQPRYPLELYESALEYKMPWDVKIKRVEETLNTPKQYEKWNFTHDTNNFNNGILCSAYKTLPSMKDKLKGQMDLAVKIRAVNASDVARLVIDKHFLKDIKGNLRKFSQQQFRCVNCNTKYRRPPLTGNCLTCKGKIIFTISHGSIIKYLAPSISLAEKYNVAPYVRQTLELTKRRVEGVFGKDKEKQTGLGAWFSA